MQCSQAQNKSLPGTMSKYQTGFVFCFAPGSWTIPVPRLYVVPSGARRSPNHDSAPQGSALVPPPRGQLPVLVLGSVICAGSGSVPWEQCCYRVGVWCWLRYNFRSVLTVS